jgi:hypothetical protein
MLFELSLFPLEREFPFFLLFNEEFITFPPKRQRLLLVSSTSEAASGFLWKDAEFECTAYDKLWTVECLKHWRPSLLIAGTGVSSLFEKKKTDARRETKNGANE